MKRLLFAVFALSLLGQSTRVIELEPAHPPVRDRVNAMNAKLKSASGTVGMFIDPKCKRLVKDLEQVVWKADSNGNTTGEIDKRNPELTHVSDALGYLVHREFALREKADLFPVISVGSSDSYENSDATERFDRPSPWRLS